ncbi:MAG: hypothetical protein MUO26_14755 [Methanotrichaceae archaeon]|nr:hypothetical protein [Methanotrichaceae archaeon]
MRISENQRIQMKELDDFLLSKIKSRTNLEIADIRSLDMGEIEKKLGIEPTRPEIYFSWEDNEKDGYQSNLEFPSDAELAKREEIIDQELRNFRL